MNAVGDIILPALYNKIHLVSSNDNISEKFIIPNYIKEAIEWIIKD